VSVTVFASPEPRAASGVIDLSEWSFEHDGHIALTGDYEFYWEEFVDPVVSSHTTEIYQAVPGTWNGSHIDSTTFPAHGYASYRLTVRLNQIEPLTLKFFDAATSYRAFVDGQLVASNGSPGVDASVTEPGSYPLLTDFVPTSKDFVLVLHIANFDYQKGGAWEKITLGTGDQTRFDNRTIPDSTGSPTGLGVPDHVGVSIILLGSSTVLPVFI